MAERGSGFPALDRLTVCLSRLPGIGRRSAERMALRLVRQENRLMQELVDALQDAQRAICCCSACGSVTPVEANPCRLCTDPDRDTRVLCVVEDPSDILALERSGGFRGRYHALMGRLSPMKGDGPRELRLKALTERIRSGDVNEVILALSTDVEGDSTAAWITEQLQGMPVRITRLATGLPAGSGVAYSDPVTLARAFRGRVPG
ncbi:MAG: recombination protein RecR [Lentisphaerae bacterium RIFOXYC12_FULL_60_16]|nr:MAG: recombination protein RecR [Lentisphaerae bacterium RIFOXYC12_FULL_60_16]OGV71592.1 MAG: recombination protein RecR [Lentisphaerae bacterium RIFOXYA12_FULL_60_10]OGV84386.1 MAG: recombination protein RecR [Lentisphaerae bacterium RIFOXYB12_FULL_60_10]